MCPLPWPLRPVLSFQDRTHLRATCATMERAVAMSDYGASRKCEKQFYIGLVIVDSFWSTDLLTLTILSFSVKDLIFFQWRKNYLSPMKISIAGLCEKVILGKTRHYLKNMYLQDRRIDFPPNEMSYYTQVMCRLFRRQTNYQTIWLVTVCSYTLPMQMTIAGTLSRRALK